MPTLQRARSLAAGGIRAVLTGDPAARRRVVDPLRARLRPTPLAGLDPLLAGYARGAEQVGVDDVVATALRTRSPLLREAVRALAERTGAVSWRAGYAELLLTSRDDDLIRHGSAIMRELVEGGDGATITTRQALLCYERTGEPFAGSNASDTAGNGSLMRLAPVALATLTDAGEAERIAEAQS